MAIRIRLRLVDHALYPACIHFADKSLTCITVRRYAGTVFADSAVLS
jgi:hypothetical protein